MLWCKALEGEIKAHAIWSAGRTRDILHRIINAPITSEALRAQLDVLAHQQQARPVIPGASLSGTIARMQDAAWWARNVRRELLRENEANEYAQCAIQKHRQCYVSDHAVKVKKARRKANEQTLASLEVINELGEIINLGEVASRSVSNPAIRRGELMMRCRGFEEVAKVFGHVARFLTITCPSRFHRFTGSPDQQNENPKWDGSTPKDAQNYLSKTWAKIRAAWGREGITPYGFRVAEPHHDGCPHWHILLWVPGGQAGWFAPLRALAGRKDSGRGLVGIAGRYAIKDSAGELNRYNHGARFDCKVVREHGQESATGYIAKYIGKNLDGLRQDGDSIGQDDEAAAPATESSNRVRDWASTWGIRQFQQIGGPSVTVWRELRRMRDELPDSGNQLAFDFEGVRKAADDSRWAQFWILQGGPETPRKQLSMRPFMTDDGQGKYGDMVCRILGVTGRNDSGEYLLRTRIHEWTTQRAGMGLVNIADMEQREWMEITAEMREIETRLGLPLSPDVRFPVFENFGAQRPRTRVNNCTQPSEKNFGPGGLNPEMGAGKVPYALEKPPC